jgi:1-acyl-sn-glycerol-3-phosphate acyltransferase
LIDFIQLQRRIPVFLSHVWGIALMRLTRCYPTMKNLDILQRFYQDRRPAMFVANHCSWMDIPFLGATIGWRNYKLISKKELGAVPILGTAIRAGGHIMVDRIDRRSQLATLKQGIGYLKVSARFVRHFTFEGLVLQHTSNIMKSHSPCIYQYKIVLV